MERGTAATRLQAFRHARKWPRECRGGIPCREPPATNGRARMALLKTLKEFMEMPPYGHVPEWLWSGLQIQPIFVFDQRTF
jgi:hypothetical protein